MQNEKIQAYNQHIRPLVDQIFKLAEEHKINFAAAFEIADGDAGHLLTSGLVDQENNGDSIYALACMMISDLPPSVVMTIASAMQHAINEVQAANNPHGVAH